MTRVLSIILALFCISAFAFSADNLPLHQIRLPEGFEISIYCSDVPNARAMTLGDRGTVFAGSRTAGRVYAVVDGDGDNRAEKVFTIAEDLRLPVGVDFYRGDLYVSEISRVIRFRDIEDRLENPPLPEVVNDSFPDDFHHGWKFIAFGPDDKLYVPVGAPCNVCEKSDERYASIMRMNPDGTELELYASGVRNTVGFDWRPETKELWFTENGRDWMGDNRPPDELNYAPQKGMHFGFPYVHGSIRDPRFGKGKNLERFTPPVQELGPHVAALGMRFYTGDMFPEQYRGKIFIAEHGSWNRTKPIGYRVTMVGLDGDKSTGYEIFAEGWLRENGDWGRPVDVLVMPDGALLVSDDKAGVIYRIFYGDE